MTRTKFHHALWLLFVAAAALHADPTIDEIFALGRVSDLAISPDGKQIAYALKGRIHLVQSDGSGDRVLARGGDPRWSPTGGKLAFFADAEGFRQIWTINATGGEPSKLTQHDGFIDRFRWAPDGSRIAFLARLEDQADLHYFVRSRVSGKPTVVDRNNLPRNRLWLVDVETTSTKSITSDEFSVGGYEQWFPDGFSWSPDGDRIAFSKRPHAKAGSHLDGDVAVVDVNSGLRRKDRGVLLGRRRTADSFHSRPRCFDAGVFSRRCSAKN